MRKINRPDFNQDNVCDAYKFLVYKDIIIQQSKNYIHHFSNLDKLLKFEMDMIDKDVKYKDEQNKMYNERFSNNSYKSLYEFYLAIRKSTEICPFCNFPTRTISQVDHFFPKAIFPSLSITVDNLVPICRDCNSKQNKGDYYSTDLSKMIIHPYFDEFISNASEYIICEIIESDKNTENYNV